MRPNLQLHLCNLSNQGGSYESQLLSEGPPNMTAKQDTGPSEESIERMLAFAGLLSALEREDAREMREERARLRALGITVRIGEVTR